MPSLPRLPLAALLLACHAKEPSVVSLPPVDAAAAPRHDVARPPPATSGALEWRIVAKKFVEDPNGGVPKEMWVNVELRVGGQHVTSFHFGEPDCNEGQPEGKIVARLECYYAGWGDYVDVVERAPNDFEVVSYGQEEGYADEPDQPKQGMKVVARFRAEGPLAPRLVEPDGGR